MNNETKTGARSGWLNSGRIRRQALLLTIALWLGYAVNMTMPGMRDRFGHLKGADFLHAYVLGTVALEHLGDALYDARAQRTIGEMRVPESAGDYFLPVYGPQYSLLWAPLALLPYGWAAAVWMVLSAAIYASCCYAVWRTCGNLRGYGGTVILLAAAFPGFFSLITFGQNSALALACFTGAYFALRARREILAGVCIGLLAYKPQLALVAACVFVAASLWPVDKNFSSSSEANSMDPALERLRCAGNTRMGAGKVVLGAIIAVAAQCGVAWFWYGSAPLIVYAHVLWKLGPSAAILEPRPYLMHSLRAFWNLLLPWHGAAFLLYCVTGAMACAYAIAYWRRPIALEQRFAVLLLVTVLVAPHLTAYDLVVVAPALLWIGDWLQTHASQRIAWLAYFAYILPFAGPLAQWTHVQLSVIVLTALTVSFGARVGWRCGANTR